MLALGVSFRSRKMSQHGASINTPAQLLSLRRQQNCKIFDHVIHVGGSYVQRRRTNSTIFELILHWSIPHRAIPHFPGPSLNQGLALSHGLVLTLRAIHYSNGPSLSHGLVLLQGSYLISQDHPLPSRDEPSCQPCHSSWWSVG